ncbi:MAG: RNA polymerase sigma factor [Planctomycetota bacterium]
MLQKSHPHNYDRSHRKNRQTYEAIICENYRKIYRFMVYLTNDSILAEDLTQETFAAAWADLVNYRSKAAMRTWLHRIAYNKFIDSKRKLKRSENFTAVLKERAGDTQMTAFNPLKRLITEETSLILLKALHRLEKSDYVTVVLHYIQGLSFRQMSKILQEPVGTIKWRTSKALKELKKLLTDKVNP